MLRFFTVSRLALNTNLIVEIGSNSMILNYCCNRQFNRLKNALLHEAGG